MTDPDRPGSDPGRTTREPYSGKGVAVGWLVAITATVVLVYLLWV